MNRSLSAYLDIARFTAAFAVVLAHIEENWLPGHFPFCSHLGLEAVGLFFVLSGFVIGYVVEEKENRWQIYVKNRVARLYSVVIPCLSITLLLDVVDSHLNLTYVQSHWPQFDGAGKEILKDIYSLTFLNSVWSMQVIPGSDAPFWTLGYEVAYYAVFGFAFFVIGVQKYILSIILCFCVGPKIVCLFPLWLIGFVVFRFCRTQAADAVFGRLLFFGSLTAWIVADYLRWYFQIGVSTPRDDLFWSETLWQLYWGGLFFAVIFIGFWYTDFCLPSGMEKVVRWVAGSTFTLYLIHWPIIRFVDSLLPGSLPTETRWFAMLSAAVASAFLVARFTEHKKQKWRRAIDVVTARMMSSLQSRRAAQS